MNLLGVLEELNDEEFKEFKRKLYHDSVFQRSRVEKAQRTDVVDLMMDSFVGSGSRRVFKDMNRSDLVQRLTEIYSEPGGEGGSQTQTPEETKRPMKTLNMFSSPQLPSQIPIMRQAKSFSPPMSWSTQKYETERILQDFLDSLTQDQFDEFKQYLRHEVLFMTESNLETASRRNTVTIMIQMCGASEAMLETRRILRMMGCTDLVQKLTKICSTLEGPSTSDPSTPGPSASDLYIGGLSTSDLSKSVQQMAFFQGPSTSGQASSVRSSQYRPIQSIHIRHIILDQFPLDLPTPGSSASARFPLDLFTSDPSTSGSSTRGPSTSNPSTSDPSASDPFIPGLSTSDLSTSEPSIRGPITSDLSTSKSFILGRSTSNPSTSDPSASDSSIPGPSTSDLSTSEPSIRGLTISEPSTPGLITSDLSIPGLTTSDPSTSESSTLDPSTSESSTLDPSTSESSTLVPSTLEPSIPGLTTSDMSTPCPTPSDMSASEPPTPSSPISISLDSDPSVPGPSTSDPSIPDLSIPGPTPSDMSTSEPSTPSPSTSEPSSPGPFTSDKSFRLCEDITEDCVDEDDEINAYGSEKQTFVCTEAQAGPSDWEEFTPEDSAESGTTLYRFRCPRSGSFHCTQTGLVFVVNKEAGLQYRTVQWDEDLLESASRTPAGPLFNIECPENAIRQLHFPHCEIEPAPLYENLLSIAHITNHGMSFIDALEITDTHVVIDVPHLSKFGVNSRRRRGTSKYIRPVSGQVLLFLTPPNTLEMHLLSINVDVDDVKAFVIKEEPRAVYLRVPAECELITRHKYSVDCCYEDEKIHCKEKMFDLKFGPNYHMMFQICLPSTTTQVSLTVNDQKNRELWNHSMNLPAPAAFKRPRQNLPPKKKLLSVGRRQCRRQLCRRRKIGGKYKRKTKMQLLSVLQELGDGEFEEFKWFLNQEKQGDIPPITKNLLEKAMPTRVVDLVVQRYEESGAVEVIRRVLKNMNMNELRKKLRNLH